MNSIKVAVIVVILMMTGTGLYFFSISKNKSINDNGAAVDNSSPPTETPIVNMANPASVYCKEHGGQSVIRTAADGSQSGVCVFENGNECDEWMYFRGECSNPSAVLTPGTEKAIQVFLANKYQKPISEVKVTINKEAPGFAAGSVLYGQGGPGEGGIWLAVAGNQWDVVWDGNGNVDCNKMRQQYGFPDSILKPNFCN